MAEFKLYNLKDPKTGEEETQISSKEEFDILKQKLKPDQIENPRTGQQGDAETVVKEVSNVSPEDGRNVAMDVAKCLRDALREHGDEIKAIFLKNSTNEGASIRVQYMPDEQGHAEEDEFEFRWPDGKVRLDNVANPVDLCDLQIQSGTVKIQKDLVKNGLLKFLSSHDEPGTGSVSAPVDPNKMPDGQPVNECGDLWESEECAECFCKAVYNFRNNPENKKEAIKDLLRAARPYKKGNTIQEKLKEAVDWYNIYKENPPKNTKKQVFLESTVPGPITGLCKIEEGLEILAAYVDKSEDLHFGSYYRDLKDSFLRLCHFTTANKSKYVQESYDEDGNHVDDDIQPNHAFDYEQDLIDEPVYTEEDEWGPEPGDSVDYEGGHYKFYGYCGYDVVLQNVDDERDFKVVKPADIGLDLPNRSLKELENNKGTQWVDPDELPEDFGM